MELDVMGLYVHLSVVFPCNNNEPVAELAKKHTSNVIEAQWFLDDLSQRKGTNPGPKGGVSTWGLIGNYTRADKFVESLRKFWIDLINCDEFCDHEHIIVFYEREQTEQAHCYEIYLEEGSLIIKHHDLPFCWNQY